MPSIHRSALVEFSAEQMFDLVNDIERYPEFLPGCRGARVISVDDKEMLGELSLARAGMGQRFTTRNRLDRPRSISVSLEDGSFSRFSAEWRFKQLGDAGCRIDFDMEFEFSSNLVDRATKSLFSSVADNLVDTIVAQARRRFADTQ